MAESTIQRKSVGKSYYLSANSSVNIVIPRQSLIFVTHSGMLPSMAFIDRSGDINPFVTNENIVLSYNTSTSTLTITNNKSYSVNWTTFSMETH